MKKFIAKYMLYIYLNFIKDNDLDIYKKWALFIIKPTIFIRGIYFWILSILLFPIFYFGMELDDVAKKNRKKIAKYLNIYLKPIQLN
jgi:hypothetical protein